jgi:hypothetical protein
MFFPDSTIHDGSLRCCLNCENHGGDCISCAAQCGGACVC